MTPAPETRPRAIRGITVLCDVLRPDGQGRPGGVDRSAAWLTNAIKRQLALAAGLPVNLLTPSTCPDLATWITASRTPAAADRFWASIYNDLPAHPGWNEAIERLILVRLRDQFCVGYELPPYLVRLLDRHAIPYVDIRLHPVRFLDDLIFAVRASLHDTQNALAVIAMPEAEVIITAGLREASCRYISDAAVPPHTLLVIGQRRYDSSQIQDGRFFDAMDRQADIAAICAHHRAVILKSHPHDREHSLLAVAAGVAKNVIGATDDNLYRLLSLPEVTAILTVSSSAAHEAGYFGKTVHALAPPCIHIAWRGDTAPAGAHLSLDDTVLSVDFWRLVLAPHTKVSARDNVRLPAKPNRLRIALDSFWNFNQIDTDRIPARGS